MINDKDIHVVAAAVAAKADFLITLDHLRSILNIPFDRG